MNQKLIVSGTKKKQFVLLLFYTYRLWALAVTKENHRLTYLYGWVDFCICNIRVLIPNVFEPEWNIPLFPIAKNSFDMISKMR